MTPESLGLCPEMRLVLDSVWTARVTINIGNVMTLNIPGKFYGPLHLIF